MAAVAGNAVAEEAKKPVAAPKDAFEIAARLQKPPKADLFQEQPTWKLGLVIAFLSDELGAPILVDYRTFPNAADTRTMLAETDVRPPDPSRSVELHLASACHAAQWAFVIEKDHIRIIDNEAWNEMTADAPDLPDLRGGLPLDKKHLLPEEQEKADRTKAARAKWLPTITRKYDAVPLKDVLAELQERAGRTLALAGAAQKAADTPISVSFLNAPFESSVLTLGEVAGLQPLRNGTVSIFVTRDRYAELHPKKAAVKPATDAAPATPAPRPEIMFHLSNLYREWSSAAPDPGQPNPNAPPAPAENKAVKELKRLMVAQLKGDILRTRAELLAWEP